jgi:hypothetical protein
VQHKLTSGRPKRSSLADLVSAARTADDLQTLAPLIPRLRAFRIEASGETTDAWIARCVEAGAPEHALELLSNRPGFPLFPTQQGLTALLRALGSPTTDEALDTLYKAFSLFMYHGVPPSAEAYDVLIDAGNNSGLEEGKRRSAMAAAEKTAFGL